MAPVSCVLLRLLKSPPGDSAPLLLPKRLEPPAFDVGLNMLAVWALEVAGDSCGLLAPSEKPLKPPVGAAVDVVGCWAEDDCPKLAKGFAALGAGGLPNRTDPLLAPELVVGGGPAGVVEFPKRFEVGLLVGVVLAVWPAVDMFEPRLPKEKPPPVLAPPPK